jgi:hypothetical protein
MRTPPYNNGKIKIGEFYEPPKYVEQDRDMLEIQKWLIGDPERLRLEHWIDIGYKIAIGFIVFVMVLMNIRS